MRERTVPPFLVLEGPAGSASRELDRLRAAGYAIVSGVAAVGRPSGRTVCHCVVASDQDGASALLAALAGYGLLVEIRSSSAAADRLVDDLRHLGAVDYRVVGDDAPVAISAVAQAILRLLADGRTLGDAAALLGLSRRTADRRVAEARRAFGVERTTEAIAAARRAGWLRPPPRDGSPRA